jgi:hypothetical protein
MEESDIFGIMSFIPITFVGGSLFDGWSWSILLLAVLGSSAVLTTLLAIMFSVSSVSIQNVKASPTFSAMPMNHPAFSLELGNGVSDSR